MERNRSFGMRISLREWHGIRDIARRYKVSASDAVRAAIRALLNDVRAPFPGEPVRRKAKESTGKRWDQRVDDLADSIRLLRERLLNWNEETARTLSERSQIHVAEKPEGAGNDED
jgi:hypothetical protein